MIPFSPPRIDQRIIDEVTDSLRSGWITTGPKTRLFEQRLTAYGGQRATRCLASATAGLELMLRWFGVGPGDEVVVPAYTYCATANVVVHCGARPVLVDVGDDFLADPRAVQRAITPKTKAVIPVDFGGMPCDYPALHAIVESPAVRDAFTPAGEPQRMLGRPLVLSDAAHALGARRGSARAGSFTDVTVFSFHAVKNLTTAEGGAVALNLPPPFDNDAVCRTLGILSLHGQTKDAFTKQQAGQWKYDVEAAGFKCNMPDVLAAIGLAELERYETETLPRRKAICEAYAAAFREKPWAVLPRQRTAAAESAYHLFPLRLRGFGEPERDAVIRRIFRKDVSVNVHFIPLPLLSYYRHAGYRMDDYPEAYRHYAGEISLPVYFDLTDEQLRRVAAAVIESVEAEGHPPDAGAEQR
jgi:dTDP-4-amino-4,6-dideoxygalactose transaminase